MRKTNRTYILILFIFLVASCNQILDEKRSEDALDPSMYAHIDHQPQAILPIHGFKESDSSGKTIYHTIPDWEFINQNGEKVSSEEYKGQIYVTEFFFTNCPTICPKMTVNMHALQSKTKHRVQFCATEGNVKAHEIDIIIFSTCRVTTTCMRNSA